MQRVLSQALWKDIRSAARKARLRKAAIAYVTASRLPLVHEAYWAPIAAVVSLYPERKATVKAGVQQFLGSAVGGLVGWAGASWWHDDVLVYAVAVLLAVLASGWRYHGRPRLPATIGVGLLSGLGSGAVQIAGPPVILYWLGGAGQAAYVRANLMVYFTFIDVIGCIAYFRQGLFTREVAALSLLLGLPFILAMVAGVRWFRGASELTFRRVAYAIIALSALISLPVFDGLLR